MRGLITLLFLSVSILAWSQESAPLEELRLRADELKVRMEFMDAMLKSADRLDREFQMPFHAIDDQIMEKVLKREVDALITLQGQSISVPRNIIERFLKRLSRLNWREITRALKHSYIGVETFFRRKGPGIAIAVLAGFVVEYTMPIFLVSIGHPGLIPVSLSTPWGTMFSTIPEFLHRLHLRAEITRALGGKQAYKAYRAQVKMAETEFSLLKPKQLLIPLLTNEEGKTELLVLPKGGWWRTILQRLGLMPTSFSYVTLEIFLIENGLENEYTLAIKALPGLDANTKAALIISHLAQNQKPEIFDKLTKRFSRHFASTISNPDWERLWPWVSEMRKKQNLDEILEGLSKLPEGTSTLELSLLWEKILLPHYAEKSWAHQTGVKRLYDQFASLQALHNSEQSLTREFDTRALSRFRAYLSNSWDRSYNTCIQTPAQVLGQMLR
jgi:hypothetical protein